MPHERTLRTIFGLARANGLKEDMLAALKATILQHGEDNLASSLPPPP
jgi:hypothetical protein